MKSAHFSFSSAMTHHLKPIAAKTEHQQHCSYHYFFSYKLKAVELNYLLPRLPITTITNVVPVLSTFAQARPFLINPTQD